MGEAVLNGNVANCLLGEAERWYTEEISNLTRRGLQMASIQEWCDALERRFRDEPSKSLLTVMQERYTVQNVRRRREPTEYMQRMVTAGRNAHRDANEAAICMLAYEHIDGILQQHVAKPNYQTTIQDFMASLREARILWFDIYTSYSNTGPGETQNGRQSSNMQQERRGLPPGRFNTSNTPSYCDNGRRPDHQQGNWNNGQPGYMPSRQFPSNSHGNQNNAWQGQRFQQGLSSKHLDKAIDGPTRTKALGMHNAGWKAIIALWRSHLAMKELRTTRDGPIASKIGTADTRINRARIALS
ncbi:MAG: hypothetical protein M1816_001421 [Peltula sp. TS41687]|nr:MAG: hypothetical protein M1816_001421 [Peltula sp. TS41687]